jgi:hypothetical protein
MSWARVKEFFRKMPTTVGRTPLGAGLDILEYPRIARFLVVRIRCRFCGGGLHDDDIVVWFERHGRRSDLAHAECAVFIKEPDGTIVRPSGTVVTRPVIVAGTLLLTRGEWEGWRTIVSTSDGSGGVREVEK